MPKTIQEIGFKECREGGVVGYGNGFVVVVWGVVCGRGATDVMFSFDTTFDR